ncbi:HupE/UreJ family protein [Solidesulfovibrio sp.]|uniref:HupE/UreJ family protein n=1 Tax=Solidesulfovibrio sp. TaxID=2910990 RepID=UPI002628F27F|nr:HupE/UreJ family protein [Solidesulfovibrio sp.]
MKAYLAVLCLLAALWPRPAAAHETRPAYLELRETAPGVYDVLWRTPLYEGLRLPFDLRFPEEARVLGAPRTVAYPDWHLETWRMAVPGGILGKPILFRGHEATTAGVVARLLPLGGPERTVVVPPGREAAVFSGRPAGFFDFLLSGVRHILYGPDHLLFIAGLLCLVSGGRVLVETVTAFTLAHSLTLAAATLGWAEVPVEAVNAAVGLSILFLGPEIVRRLRGEASLTVRFPWLAAFAFGLLHGFGFAGSLTGLGLSRRELLVALLGFNCGVEVGQLAFVAALLGLWASVRRLGIRPPDWASYVPAYVVGSAGAYLTLSRTLVLLGK